MKYLGIEIDLESNDKKYWKSVKSFLNWACAGRERGDKSYGTAKEEYKHIRNIKYNLKFKKWNEGRGISEEIKHWAGIRLYLISMGFNNPDKFNNPDNFRMANKRNSKQVRRYKKIKELGCCGCYDTEEVGPDGQTYLLGFNYGH